MKTKLEIELIEIPAENYDAYGHIDVKVSMGNLDFDIHGQISLRVPVEDLHKLETLTKSLHTAASAMQEEHGTCKPSPKCQD